LLFSEPHRDAVGTYGPLWRQWLESSYVHPDTGRLIELRPWSVPVIDRLAEHDRDGVLCWSRALLSTPRQAAKTTTAMVYGLARAAVGTWEGPQRVLWTANTLQSARRVLAQLWPWAAASGLKVSQATDAPSVLWPAGSEFRGLSAMNVWGRTADLGIVDEGWNIDPETVHDALLPAQLATRSPQVLIVSTSHREATGLVPAWLADESVCRIVWGAGPDDDPHDPVVWRRSSPVWSRQRAAACEAAQHAPGFEQQYLNVWPSGRPGGSGWPAGWLECPALAGSPPPGLLAAVEVDHERRKYGLAVVQATTYRTEVWTASCGSLTEVREQLTRWAPASVLVGASLRNDLVGGAWVVHPMGRQETAMASPLVAELVRAGRLAHDHRDGVAAEVGRARVTTLESGPALSATRSGGSIPCLKAIVWAAWAVHQPEFQPVKPQIW
jgi:hypothetical protein